MLVSNVLSLCHAGRRAGSLAVGTEAKFGRVNRARRRRSWPHRKKRNMRVYELAYSTTSSSAETSFLARRCISVQARQPEIV